MAHSRYSTLDFLHPKCRKAAVAMEQEFIVAYQTKLTRHLFKPFETYRSLQRQAELLKAGTTKAGPWQSAHNYGLAVDMVPHIDGKNPTWKGFEADMQYFRNIIKRHGFEAPISWDPFHCEHESWQIFKRFL